MKNLKENFDFLFEFMRTIVFDERGKMNPVLCSIEFNASHIIDYSRNSG